MASIGNIRTKQLINKWGKRISICEKVSNKKMTLEKKAALAHALENADERIRAMEATNPANIGAYKRYALDIITACVPNLIAFDLLSVQPMDNRVGMINYIDYTYSKEKGGTAAGDMFASSLNMGKSDELYSSDIVKDQELGAAGSTAYGTSSVPLQLKWTPVRLDSVVVTAGNVIGTADATGAISGTGVTGAITADGQLYLTFTSATTDIPTITYRYDNESVQSDGPVAAGFTNVPEVEMKISSLPVTATARTMRAFWAFDAQYELQKEYGQDMETLLATQVTGELSHEIDNELTFDLLNFAGAAAPLTWSKTITPGISMVDHYDSLQAKFVEGSNYIFDATRKVKGNYIICGLGVSDVIQMMRKFEPSGVEAVGPHYLGDVAGYKVYVNPDYPRDEYVIGYKGQNLLEAGAFYCPYEQELSVAA